MTHFMRLTISKKIPTGGGDEKNEKLIIIKEPINPLIYSNVKDWLRGLFKLLDSATFNTS